MKGRDKRGQFIKGHKWSSEIEARRTSSCKGRKLSEEAKRKISIANKGKPGLRGSKNSNWKGGKIKKKCLECRKEFKVNWYRKKTAKFCSKECFFKGRKTYKGESHWHWKGGKQKNVSGHIQIYSPGHPMADSRNRVFEHRLIMEKYLGRYLKKGEVVHHIDGDASNNSINNLMLFINNVAHLRYHKFHRENK